MTIGRICCRQVVVAGAEDKVDVVARQLRDNNVGTVVVIDPDRRPLGMVTDRDLAVRVIAEGLDPRKMSAGKIMTAAPVCVSESMAIEEALTKMRSGGFRRLPVVDAEGCLAGIVTLDDVLELLAEEMEEVGELIRREAPARRFVG